MLEHKLLWVRLAITALGVAGASAQTVTDIDRAMSEALAKWSVPGGALAVAKDGRLVYARGFGFADVDARETVQADSLFRIASISKTFTSAGILKLLEDGKLGLDDRAFDILGSLQPPPGAVVDPRIRRITVRNLLQHTGGWDREISGDLLAPPYPQIAARTFNVPEPAEPEIIIRYALGQRLDFDPGTRMAYSNLGYCILGRIIEKVSGMRYDAFIRSRILAPAGIHRMFPGRVFPEERAAGEVRYYAWPGENVLLPSAFPDRPGMVEAQYGAAYPETMDAEGGWVASAIDLVRFAVAIDRPDAPVLKPESLRLLSLRPEPALVDRNGVWYGMGWYTWPSGTGVDMSHSGTLPGTRSFLIKRANGIVWSILFNSGSIGSSDGFLNDAANRVDTAVSNVRAWPAVDLFPAYYPEVPRFAATGVENQASYTPAKAVPGEAILISGAGFGEGAQVYFDGVPAKTAEASIGQIRAVIPETGFGDTSSVQLEQAGRWSDPVVLPAGPVDPGIYTANNTGRGQAAAIHPDGTANSAENPAAKGSLLKLPITGVRETDRCAVIVGGVVVDDVVLARLAPGSVEVSFRVPDNAPAGPEIPVTILAEGSKSRTGVTVAIQ